MSPQTKQFLQRWCVTTVAVLLAAQIVPGIRYDSFLGLVVASLLLGILNSFLRPLLLLLSLPLIVFSLGFFFLVINGLLLYLVGSLVASFHVDGFWAAFFGALLISMTSVLLHVLIGGSHASAHVRTQRNDRRGSSSRDENGSGGGPVIDV